MSWNKYVENLMSRYKWNVYEPGAVVGWYHGTKKELAQLEEKLKNPVKPKTGERLSPAYIKQLEIKRKGLIETEHAYRKLIKHMVKFNLLPTSKLISGEDRQQFVFTLLTMLALPELGKVTYWANRLTDAQFSGGYHATNEDYEREHRIYKRPTERKEGERSREDLYDSLVAALNETMRRLIAERWKFIHPDKKQPKPRFKKAENTSQNEKPKPSKVFVLKTTDTEDRAGGDRTRAFAAGDKFLSTEFKDFLEQPHGKSEKPPLA